MQNSTPKGKRNCKLEEGVQPVCTDRLCCGQQTTAARQQGGRPGSNCWAISGFPMAGDCWSLTAEYCAITGWRPTVASLPYASPFFC
jgi:hypothetical protein